MTNLVLLLVNVQTVKIAWIANKKIISQISRKLWKQEKFWKIVQNKSKEKKIFVKKYSKKQTSFSWNSKSWIKISKILTFEDRKKSLVKTLWTRDETFSLELTNRNQS